MPVLRLRTLLEIRTSVGGLYNMSGAVQLYRHIQNSRFPPTLKPQYCNNNNNNKHICNFRGWSSTMLRSKKHYNTLTLNDM